ncbi:phospholipase C/P1 nuclease domain-containing protein [Bisporella sp. PMI_857]|nr:phospholipase C/P1 nuclease domain-containing protein [Bisporella sp. PMI_857]
MKLGKLNFLASLSVLPQAFAWGTLGHTTVAYIASNLVSPPTKTYFQALLLNTTDSYLANVATWADSFRYTQAGRFSAPLHFIDANDSPPEKCSVQYVRDCGEKGCIVGAVANYTRQLLNPDLAFGSRNMAAKFIIHFLGDIHQPLHSENLARGGNSIDVTFDKQTTNLHHVWDSNIPEKLVGGYSLAHASLWAANLTAAIQNGAYSAIKEGWLEGMNIQDPASSALAWATETNLVVCSTVLRGGVEKLKGKDLGGEYYAEAVPVVQLQVARAGYRLAAWLDLIAEGLKTEL